MNALAGTETSQLRMGPLRIRVGRRHVGNGTPLVLINGIGGSMEMWQPFVEALDDREVLMLDLPGCGQSSSSRMPLRMRDIAGIVARAMDAFGILRADVLGYSFGGVVAQELAHRHPNRVRRLVLCATTPGLPSVYPHPLVIALMANPARYYDPRLGELIVPLVSGGRTAADRTQLHDDVKRRQAHPPSLTGYSYQLLALAGWSSWPWLFRLPHRTLVVHGGRDPLSPSMNARLLASSLRNGRLHLVPHAGHLLLIDEPEHVVDEIQTHLDD